MELLMYQLLNSLIMSLIFALAASGLSVIMGLQGIINITHCSVYMIAAYFAYTLATSLRANFWLSLIGGCAASAIMALALFLTLIKPLSNRSPVEVLIALFGASLIFEQLARSLWGAEPRHLVTPKELSGSLKFHVFGFDVTYPLYYIFVLLISIAVLGLIHFVYTRSGLGIKTIASIQNKEMAEILGVNTRKLGIVNFIIGSVLAGFAGVLSSPIFSLQPTMGSDIFGLLFTIVVIGGMGSILGTLVAALVIFSIKFMGSIFLHETINEIIILCFLLIILYLRPRGFMGLKGVLE